MIDENKLIKELCELGKSVEKHIKESEKNQGEAAIEFGLRNQLAMLHNVIKKVKEQPKTDKWILRSERLPEESGYYLVKRCNSLICKMPTEIYPDVLYFEKPKIWLESPRSFQIVEDCYVIEWHPI